MTLHPTARLTDTFRVLVTGGSGYLGSALLRYLGATRPDWQVHATFFSIPPAPDHPQAHPLDLRDGSSIQRVLHLTRPHAVIHTAAQMQGTRDELDRVNARGTERLAQLAAEAGARLVHLSTDVVFDGRHGNYREEDEPHPLTDYGASKLAAERAVLVSGAHAVIVRTSLIYGFRPLDPRTRAVLTGEMAQLFTDERRSPIWVENLCEALTELVESDVNGILHVAGSQALSRYEFGVKLVRALGGDKRRLIPVHSADSGMVRPLDCTLDCSRARERLRTNLLGVDAVIAQLNRPAQS